MSPGTPRAPGTSAPDATARTRSPLMLGSVLLAGTGLCALLTTVGADARWLAALGRFIASRQRIPAGVPFAAAPSGHWANPIVLAQLVFHWLEATMGDRGLMLASVLGVAVALALLAQGAIEAGATPAGAGAMVLIVIAGSLPALVIARSQMFSVALFPALLVLLRRDARQPSARIWLVPLLLALWSNLHGAVLSGLGVTLVYLVLERRRHGLATAAAVGALSLLAVCATSAGIDTVAYYHGVFTSAVTERGQQLWAPLSLGHPLDVLLVLAAVVLARAAARSRPAAWEVVGAVALAAATVSVSRSGIWLLFLLAAPAANGIRPTRAWPLLRLPLALVSLVAIGFAVARGPVVHDAGHPLLARALAIAHGSPILAEDLVAEQVALAGGRVWMSDPIDAFSRADQAAYLEWVMGEPAGRAALRPAVRVVLVEAGGAAMQLMARNAGFRLAGSDRRVQMYVRTGLSTAGTRAAAATPGPRREADGDIVAVFNNLEVGAASGRAAAPKGSDSA